MTAWCGKCRQIVEQMITCDCFERFCESCFEKHSCRSKELASQPEKTERPEQNGMPLRPYQGACLDGIRGSLKSSKRTLVVMPTGTGKTIVFAHIAHKWKQGRVLVMAHRDELIRQAADKISRVTGEACEIEMAQQYANTRPDGAKVVITSVQTMSRESRHGEFKPSDFGLLVIDEAHHATAKTYRRVIDYFTESNPGLYVLGVTATPDRSDEQALGQVFQTVSFEYGILDAIGDGWLVPIEQQLVFVNGLDFSKCRTTAGDLNGADLSAVMEEESILHRVVAPTLELAGDQQTLVFAASVKHAERMSEIANRHKEGCAEIVHGNTPMDLRRNILQRYSRREFQFLFNCAIATEGFDEPGIGVVAIARPTKSRALYAQMVGRGTRPLPGIVDQAQDRRASILASSKPSLLVLDFVGNAGRHKLINSADVLGGNYDDVVVDRAKGQVADKSKRGEPSDISEELKIAQKAEDEERRRRKSVVAKASYGTKDIDPFDLLDITPKREPGWHKGRPPTERQVAALRKFKIKDSQIESLSFWQASQLLDKLFSRIEEGKCTVKQAAILAKYGYSTDVTFDQAKAAIDMIASNGWRRPAAA